MPEGGTKRSHAVGTSSFQGYIGGCDLPTLRSATMAETRSFDDAADRTRDQAPPAAPFKYRESPAMLPG